jgi:hypothetical protein
MPDSDDTNPAVARELQQAQQALDDATKARAADLSDAAVINRPHTLSFIPSRQPSTTAGSSPRLMVA